MRDDEVDHHLEAQAVRLGDQIVEILQRTEHRVDAAIIGHVVAEILHRGGEKGRYPDRVDTQRGDIGGGGGGGRR